VDHELTILSVAVEVSDQYGTSDRHVVGVFDNPEDLAAARASTEMQYRTRRIFFIEDRAVLNRSGRNTRGDTMSRTLGEELPKEMARIRDVVMPAYQECGPSAALTLALMRHDLDRAAKALAEGDLPAMIDAYQALKEYKL
jgi:hypothetical protein